MAILTDESPHPSIYFLPSEAADAGEAMEASPAPF
jgi:hypothetical protein